VSKLIPTRLRTTTQDTTRLVRDYLLQETVDPLRVLGRYVVFGTLGSFFVGAGALMLLVSLLRLMQGETSAFHGNLSWIPYLIIVIVAAAVIALTVYRIVTGPARRRRPLPQKESR
jgi:branched-subunit amino acid ABC-type transport system permease component